MMAVRIERPESVSAPVWAAMTDREQRAAARLIPEEARLMAMLRAATAPADCGPEIPVAPARGGCRAFTVVQVVPGAHTAGPGEELPVEDAGYRGPGEDRPRRAVAVADVFDRMDVAARRARKPAPLTPGQIAIARRYRTLVERHDAGGIKLSSIEGRTGGSGGRGADVTDLRLIEAREIAALRRRIGEGAAMVVRRVRPSKRGLGASIILDRRLVDAVCLEDMDPSAVLRAHGWSVDGKHQMLLSAALSGALDRMQGYVGTI
ncbi:hypothetical protein [Paenirhodobacter enshiensis]|uniref:hypothetical protein n=1 Tax=Paenirhodobacter enshiensis TaxID=1105367 RepID=UPI003FA33B2B